LKLLWVHQFEWVVLVRNALSCSKVLCPNGGNPACHAGQLLAHEDGKGDAQVCEFVVNVPLCFQLPYLVKEEVDGTSEVGEPFLESSKLDVMSFVDRGRVNNGRSPRRFVTHCGVLGELPK